MQLFTGGYDAIQPTLVERECGGWLAVSQPGAPLRIGVIGKSADDAAKAFGEALAKWIAALSVPFAGHDSGGTRSY